MILEGANILYKEGENADKAIFHLQWQKLHTIWESKWSNKVSKDVTSHLQNPDETNDDIEEKIFKLM